MVDRVFGSRDEVVPLFIFDASKSGFKSRPSKRPPAEEDVDPHEGTSAEGEQSLREQTLTSPNSGSNSSNSDDVAADPKRSSKKQKTTRKNPQPSEAQVDGNKKQLLSILEKQVELLERGQEREMTR